MTDNEQENDKDLMKNKFVFMTINKSKGLERKIIFFYSLDDVFDSIHKNAVTIPN